MSRRYWLSLIAVVVLTASLAHAQGVGNDAESKPRATRSASQPKPDAPPSIPVSVQNDIKSIARALEAANNKPEPEAEKRRAEQDLKAQKDMATWALGMLLASGADILLTGVGIFLIWRTLVHTKDAAKAARDAVTAQEIANSVTKAQISADMKIDTAEFYIVPHKGAGYGDHPQVVIKSSNSGNSRANAFRWNVRVLYHHDEETEIRGNTDIPPEPWGIVVAAGESIEQRTNCLPAFLTEKEKAAVAEGSLNVFMEIEIAYGNIFGETVRDKSTFAATIYKERDLLGRITLRRVPISLDEMVAQMALTEKIWKSRA